LIPLPVRVDWGVALDPTLGITTIRRLNVFLRKTLAPAAAGTMLLAAAFALAIPAPAAAQEVVQDEGAFYRAWHDASQAGDNAKAIAAAKTYLEKYPTGQYADFIKKWLSTAQMTALDTAIKQRRTADMIKVGREILASDPENLNVLYALAFNILRNELLASPPKYDHAADAKEFAQKAIALVEGGKTLVGVQNFNKDATLAWLYQTLAMVEGNAGDTAEALKLYDKSSSLAPDDVAIKGRNLLNVLAMEQSSYAEAAKAYNALPEADRAAAEPPETVTAAREALNAEADRLIDTAVTFVAFGKAKNLPAATIDRVNQLLETVYKARFPEDTSLEGLNKMLAAKGAPTP
jgi:tetratricopeptide (TPR) repeat protein